MKHFVCVALCLLFALGFACAPATASNGNASASETAANTPEPTAEPEPLGVAPIDLLGKGYNLFIEEAFPAGYIVYGAYFNHAGSSEGSGGHFVLCLTAEGNRADIVRYCAGLLGVTDEAALAGAIDSMTNDMVAEISGTYAGSSSIATLKGTSADQTFDECEEVDGCRVELSIDVSSEQASRYEKLILANENSLMLGNYADQLNASVMRQDMHFLFVNIVKPQNTMIGVVYSTDDPLGIASDMAHALDSTWYDERTGMMGLSYGPQNANLYPDYQQNVIMVVLYPNDNSIPASEYRMSEVSLTKLGFQYFPEDGLAIYKEDQNHLEIAISKPGWHRTAEDWNFEFLGESNGYSLYMIYTEATGLFYISVTKGNEDASAEYAVAENAFTSNIYPDEETQKRLFSEAAGITEGDHHEAVFALLINLVQDRFGMTWQELYTLPVW